MKGRSDSSTGKGVFGSADSSTGVNYGVIGQSSSTTGRGVGATALANTGVNYGLFATTLVPTVMPDTSWAVETISKETLASERMILPGHFT